MTKTKLIALLTQMIEQQPEGENLPDHLAKTLLEQFPHLAIEPTHRRRILNSKKGTTHTGANVMEDSNSHDIADLHFQERKAYIYLTPWTDHPEFFWGEPDMYMPVMSRNRR